MRAKSATRPRIELTHRLLRARNWQHRPQLDEVCAWWRAGAAGVCALVGIGGAGKTAIAERFLRRLPGVFPASPGVAVDESLATPQLLFVFSFYEAPNPDAFFEQLGAWLADAAPPGGRTPSYAETLRLLAQAGRTLILLDGLEKVQETGARGPFGRLLDGRLRDLVLRASEGYLPAVGLLLTSRYRFFDPLAEGSPCFRQLPVEKLSEPAAVALLRERGVRGGDATLRALAREEGSHALSVDLLGGYVVHFCGGDPLRLGPAPEVPRAELGAVDPHLAALAEQEHRFARLTARYAEALARGHPAALALLERVCLFRLGVEAPTLVAVFTGGGKEEIAGPALAGLDEAGVAAALGLLEEMKLLEKGADDGGSPRYTAHAAVRDGFLALLDAEATRRGHEAARQGLESAVGDQQGRYPSDPAALDLLEEIVYHTLKAGRPQEAFALYWYRIGGYENLGWRLGAYERGERLCRAFASGRPPESAPLPDGLPDYDQALFLNEWALYLKDLGRLEAAAACSRRSIRLRVQQGSWSNSSRGNLNLAGILLLAGRLGPGLVAAEEALHWAERGEWGDDIQERRDSRACRGHAQALRGGAAAALADFAAALEWQHQEEGETPRPLYGPRGYQHTSLLARLGRNREATELTEKNIGVCIQYFSEENPWTAPCRLLLADLARQRGDLAAARRLLAAAHDWALARDAREPLCWAALVHCRIELAAAASESTPSTGAQAPDQALLLAEGAAAEGLRLAREHGYGIYHIDLLFLAARLALHRGRPAAAEEALRVALDEGMAPPEDSGLPVLLAATDPDCGYAWGEAEGRQLLAEAKLLAAAQLLGRPDFAPAGLGALPEAARCCIEAAREQLKRCHELRTRIGDPGLSETERTLTDLEGGLLTAYPLTPEPKPTPPETPALLRSDEDPARPFDVFLSHNSRDKPDVRTLSEELKRRGLEVWLDEEQLVPGLPWQEALEEIIETARSVAVLVGPDGLGPWQSPEMRACLSEFVDRGLPVIPVLLPGAGAKPGLPLFLRQLTWVDLRKGLDPEGLDRLVWGITGVKPGR